MRFIEQYCKTEFTSDEDFRQNFKTTLPERFNFAFDVMDVLAEKTPDKRSFGAMIKERRRFLHIRICPSCPQRRQMPSLPLELERAIRS